ncbi:hypothetical protein RB195_010065 [Necator americanus]|uniref:4-hydroxybenzoate polyprenyltransferase, mitochondrial n=1 Tax=Necator americanus TaxID=51031 RepID=A0ABR1CW86_NECAM
MFHAAAAMLKIAELEYNGANSVFLRALIDKKFALPYKAIDAIVSHFLRMKNDERDMPVLWHQCLLAVCQRYKNDLSQEQKSAIVDLTRYHSHYLISPEIRRELESKEEESSHMVSKIEITSLPSIFKRRPTSNPTVIKRSAGTQLRYRPKIPSASDLVSAAPASVKPYLQLMRLDKPTGTWLLFWPCTWSIGLATPACQFPSLYYLTLFGTGAILMRSAGCVINDLFDKDFDRQVERTKLRPLACGSLNDRQAISLLAALLSASFAVLLQLNWFSVAVGSASTVLVVSYPLAKRFTYWPQFVLGLTFNWGALLGWSAIEGSLSSASIALYLAAIQWTLLYDTIYAHQDKADDIMIGVKSTALRFGENTKLWLGGFGCAAIAGLGLAGYLAEQTWPYYVALAATSAHLGWQVGTVKINDGNDCWKKFKSNQWFGVILFTGIVIGTLMKERRNEDVKKDSGSDKC